MSYWSNLRNAIIGVERYSDGSYFYKTWESTLSWDKATTQAKKLSTILENPAALYIFLLLPELYSMGQYKLYQGEKEIEKHPLLDFLKDPNPMQTESQFKWDYMFWRKLGTANLMFSSKVLNEQNKMYFLSSDGMEWSEFFKENSQSLFLSDPIIKQMKRSTITYKTKNQQITFPYERLQQFFDISNGIQGWFTSPSRVDALYKIIANSENALKSKNINSLFASKFLVAGKAAVSDTSKLPMGADDKRSAEASMLDDGKSIHAVKTMVDIKRFVENANVLDALDKSWMNDAFVIGKMLNIPKDVIEMLGDSTYENQEKARAAIVGYCIQPDADDFCEGILRYFGLDKSYDLQLDYSHLPFVQVYEKERAETVEKKANAFFKLVQAGADQAEAAEQVGLDLETFKEVDLSQVSTTEESKLTRVV